MKVTNLQTGSIGGEELLRKELENTWGDNAQVLAAVLERKLYEDHCSFEDSAGLHSAGIYVIPFDDDKTAVEVHWSFKPVGSHDTHGGCDLNLEIVA